LNISNNKLFDDDAGAGKILSDMLAANMTLKELDVSSSAAYGTASKGASLFARELAVGLSTNGTLAELNISCNGLGASGLKHLADGLRGHAALRELNISSNRGCTHDGESNAGGDTSGVVALCDAIPTIRTMTRLDISRNGLGAAGAEHLAAALPRCK
jgi:hypothetical protein